MFGCPDISHSKLQETSSQVARLLSLTIFGIGIAWVRGLVERGRGDDELYGVATKQLRLHPACSYCTTLHWDSVHAVEMLRTQWNGAP